MKGARKALVRYKSKLNSLFPLLTRTPFLCSTAATTAWAHARPKSLSPRPPSLQRETACDGILPTNYQPDSSTVKRFLFISHSTAASAAGTGPGAPRGTGPAPLAGGSGGPGVPSAQRRVVVSVPLQQCTMPPPPPEPEPAAAADGGPPVPPTPAAGPALTVLAAAARSPLMRTAGGSAPPLSLVLAAVLAAAVAAVAGRPLTKATMRAVTQCRMLGELGVLVAAAQSQWNQETRGVAAPCPELQPAAGETGGGQSDHGWSADDWTPEPAIGQGPGLGPGPGWLRSVHAEAVLSGHSPTGGVDLARGLVVVNHNDEDCHALVRQTGRDH